MSNKRTGQEQKTLFLLFLYLVKLCQQNMHTWHVSGAGIAGKVVKEVTVIRMKSQEMGKGGEKPKLTLT